MPFLLVFLVLGLSAPARAEYSFGPQPADPTTLELPLYDAPFNYENGGYTFPSMRQSMALSTGFYENVHRWIGGSGDQKLEGWRRWAIVGFDVLSTYVPLGNGWLHEEWHRAVMSRHQISSYNDVYHFPLFANVIAVSRVRDEDLARLKRENPEDQVRLSAAGMEAQVEQNRTVERHRFFDGTRTYDQTLLWINSASVSFYLFTCASSAGDRETDEQNRMDGSDLRKRDFTGLDCNAWAYDLFRPDEPYSARGTHPSGVGFNRYIKYRQLTSREQGYLRRQAWLSLLNFADPFLIGKDSFRARWFGREVEWNARLAHLLTSFGYTVDTQLFLKADDEKFLLTWHHGFARNYLPGLSLEWIDHVLGDGFTLRSWATLWPQPWRQRLAADGRQWLLRGGAEVAFHWSPATAMFVGVDAKTPGWAVGHPYVDRDLGVYMGYRLQLF